MPDRPLRVTLALYLLYLSLGIGVVTVFVTWLRFGAPGPSEFFLLNSFIMITIFHFMSPAWAMQWETHGGLLIAAIVPIALWLYYMIGKGRNWARTVLLIFVILGTLDLILRLVLPFILYMVGFSPVCPVF